MTLRKKKRTEKKSSRHRRRRPLAPCRSSSQQQRFAGVPPSLPHATQPFASKVLRQVWALLFLFFAFFKQCADLVAAATVSSNFGSFNGISFISAHVAERTIESLSLLFAVIESSRWRRLPLVPHETRRGGRGVDFGWVCAGFFPGRPRVLRKGFFCSSYNNPGVVWFPSWIQMRAPRAGDAARERRNQ